MLRAIFPLLNEKRVLPIIILFYGDTGLGKTETAKFLSNVVGENLFRKQFSMYQNNQFATYLFGGNHSEPSFAKDLLNRESNIILLDEFDKAYTTFHSAFYQLFDDGIFEDQNYSLELYKSVIICTSNYQSDKEIKQNLGNAIYGRFDAVIGFNALTESAKEQILEMQYNKQIIELDENERVIIQSANLLDKVKPFLKYYSNAREIGHIVESTISDLLLVEMIKKQSQ